MELDLGAGFDEDILRPGFDGIEEAIDVLEHFDAPEEPRLPKRYIRDFKNPFEWWAGKEFLQRYRFQKESVMHFILPIVERHVHFDTRRGLPIPAIQQLLICLRFYATASFQLVCAEIDGVSQASVSNIIRDISDILARERPTFLKFPADRQGVQNYSNAFMQLGRRENRNGIPGVIGAVDCTHIRLVNTPGQQHHEAFRNRKSYFSLNVQAVAGPQGQFLDIVARWAGSVHDSRIFNMSRLNTRFMQGKLQGILLGDNGYPCLPYLFTPILNAQTVPEIGYNSAHTKTRNVVECMFGIWKRRFPCLSRGMGNKLETVANIIVTCAVLHNIALYLKDELPELDQVHQDPPVPETWRGYGC